MKLITSWRAAEKKQVWHKREVTQDTKMDIGEEKNLRSELNTRPQTDLKSD